MKIHYFPKPSKKTPAKRLGDWTEKIFTLIIH